MLTFYRWNSTKDKSTKKALEFRHKCLWSVHRVKQLCPKNTSILKAMDPKHFDWNQCLLGNFMRLRKSHILARSSVFGHPNDNKSQGRGWRWWPWTWQRNARTFKRVKGSTLSPLLLPFTRLSASILPSVCPSLASAVCTVPWSYSGVAELPWPSRIANCHKKLADDNQKVGTALGWETTLCNSPASWR